MAEQAEQRITKTAAPSSPQGTRPHAVNRALADLRRGEWVLLHGGVGDSGSAFVQAAEAVDEESLARLHAAAGEVRLAVTLRRAAALDLVVPLHDRNKVVELMLPAVDAASIRELADPTLTRHPQLPALSSVPVVAGGLAEAAVELAKLARLLPAALLLRLPAASGAARAREIAAAEGIVEVTVQAVLDHRSVLANGLRRITEAAVPLADAEDARIVAFRPDDGGTDHLAILLGHPDPAQPVLARIHSECFTGDLLASLRCDCGEQLRGAIRAISAAGGGVVIYLAQEGRGIGLVNKLRAYALQDSGFDTVDANLQLGFDSDERVYQPAAEILRKLGYDKVRLMTNNPEKLAALARYGIEVVERVPHVFAANPHNEGYLATKAKKSGHLF